MAAPVPMSVEAMQQLQQETAQRRQSLQQATTPASVESTPRYDVLSVDKLRELVRNVDPNERLDPEVENVLLQIADEFVDNVATFSCAIARHRKSSTLDAKDVQLYLDHSWNIRVPGYTSTLTPPMRFDTQQRSRLSQTRLAAVQSAASNPRKRKAPPRP
ncbi:Transcription initiation factor TFIID subunit 12 [Plasmodiophora brassicae]